MACRTAWEVLDSAEDSTDKPLESAALSQLIAAVRVPQLSSLRTRLLGFTLADGERVCDRRPQLRAVHNCVEQSLHLLRAAGYSETLALPQTSTFHTGSQTSTLTFH